MTQFLKLLKNLIGSSISFYFGVDEFNSNVEML